MDINEVLRIWENKEESAHLSELKEQKQHMLEKMGKDILGTGVTVSWFSEVLMKTP